MNDESQRPEVERPSLLNIDPHYAEINRIGSIESLNHITSHHIIVEPGKFAGISYIPPSLPCIGFPGRYDPCDVLDVPA